MVQTWFESKYGVTKVIASSAKSIVTTNDTTKHSDKFFTDEQLSVTPLWSHAKISTYLKTNTIVVVPVSKISVLDGKELNYLLVCFKDSSNNIDARLQVYRPTRNYKLSHSKFSVDDFSGLFYQLGMDGLIQKILAIENGKFVGRAYLSANIINNNFGRSSCNCWSGGAGAGILDEIWCMATCAVNTIAKFFIQNPGGGEGGGGYANLGFGYSQPSVSPNTDPTNPDGENSGTSGTSQSSSLSNEIDNSFFGAVANDAAIEKASAKIRYINAGFDPLEFEALYADKELFAEVDGLATEEGMDANFRADALLYQKLTNESSEFAEVANTLNSLGTSGSGGDPLKNVLLDLVTEGAQEWLNNLLGIDDLIELRGLLENGTQKLEKLSFKVTRTILKFVAKKFPGFTAVNSLWKIKEVYTKINRVYKRLSGLWQNRYFVGIDQKLQKVYDSLKKNRLLSKLDVDDKGGLLTNSNKDQDVWNDLKNTFGVTPISDGRNGLKFQVDNFIFNWYPTSDSYQTPTIEIIYKHPTTGSESTIVKIRF